ncbi:MAG: ribose-phosphate pyrophosphokinase [Clostridia bacterium]|nr:ribose-phosphate pyrophosphokinase [Clostridia bacterium]
MNSFLSAWGNDLKSIPIGPLGIISMPGSESVCEKINWWLKKWNGLQEAQDEEFFTMPGINRDTFLIKSFCPRFGTGEGKGVLKETVRGFDIYIYTDVTAYNKTYRMYGMEVPMSPDDHFADLKRIICAIAGKAKRINVIMPFLYESRQHRKASRESLDCALALQELKNLGVDNLITFDAHDPRIQNAIPLGGFENVMPSYQILKALCKHVKDLKFDVDNMMFISPDEGAMQRNIYYASLLGLDLGMFYKRRDYATIINGHNPIVAHEYLGASVEGKDCIVVDDMISSGESMIDLAYELKSRRASRIFAASSFAFFTNGTESFEKAYRDGVLTKVISTNLNYRKPEISQAPWFAEADMSKYIAYIIATLNHDRSLQKLLTPQDRIKRLIEKYKAEQTASGIRLA